MKKVVYCLIFLISLQMYSQKKETSVLSLSLSYMEAYSNWDYNRMKTFYSDAIHFKDPTALEVFGPQYDVVGKDNVINMFKNVFPHSLPEYISFKIKEHFNSGTYVVINSDFELILPKTWYGDSAAGKIFVSIPMVTILRFKQGRIISHQDFVDYDSYNKQISFQLKKSEK